MKKITIILLALAMSLTFTSTYATEQPIAPREVKMQVIHGVTKTPPWVQNTTKGKKTVSGVSTWAHPVPEDAWRSAGDEKVWAQVQRADGKLVWVSFQNAPARDPKKTAEKIEKGIPVCSVKQDVNFSVAWRTDKDSHPGEKDGQFGHVGIRCYDNIGKQCPPTKGEAWQNILKLINEPTPSIPANWEPDMVFGSWLGSCN